MSNLVYAFIDNNFNSNNSIKKTYSYDLLPQYYIDTIERNSKYFNHSYFLLQNHIIDSVRDKISSNINLVSIENDIISTDEYKIVDELLKTLWDRYKTEVFLYHAFLRLIFVGIFVSKNKLSNIVHLEADNIVYHDTNKIFNDDVISSGEFAYSLVSPMVAAPGVICFKDPAAGRNFLTRIIKMLMVGEEAVMSAAGISLDYITDMNFLDIISRGSKYYKLLPSLPFTDLSTNYDKLGFLFDPASYGQYLGGTNNGHDKGYHEVTHYIGRMIQSKKIDIVYNGSPYVVYNDTQYPLYNLHIHNKKAINDFV